MTSKFYQKCAGKALGLSGENTSLVEGFGSICVVLKYFAFQATDRYVIKEFYFPAI